MGLFFPSDPVIHGQRATGLPRYQELLELASDAGAIYRFDSTVLINREIFDAYLERFHEPARKITVEEVEDE